MADEAKKKAIKELGRPDLAEPLPLASQPQPVNGSETTDPRDPSFTTTTTASAQPNVTPATPRAVVYDITVPKDAKWMPEKALAFIEHVLSQMGGTAVLRIIADKTSVRWQMVDYLVEWENVEGVVKGIRTIHPEAEVAVSDFQHSAFIQPFHRLTMPFTLGNIKVGW
ncbi:MAG: hypothetical protein HC853_08145 [Anaerolineae bacterium]|nr:hypothetical protein [Anaerolineae bacterium]